MTPDDRRAELLRTVTILTHALIGEGDFSRSERAEADTLKRAFKLTDEIIAEVDRRQAV